MHVICPNCRAVNRVQAERTAQERPVCGKCKGALIPDAPGFPVAVGDADFAKEVLQSPVPVLVDFWSASCPPCRQLEPVLQELARESAGRLKVVKVQVERAQQVPAQYGIRAVPTLILFQGGEIARCSGFRPLEGLRAWLRQHLGAKA